MAAGRLQAQREPEEATFRSPSFWSSLTPFAVPCACPWWPWRSLKGDETLELLGYGSDRLATSTVAGKHQAYASPRLDAAYMLSAEEVRILDFNSASHGVPPSLLMHNAGRAVADVVAKRYAPKRVLVLAGTGNNGGDGAVAARLLSESCNVTILYAGDPTQLKTGEARSAFDAIDRRRVGVEMWRSPERLRELLHDADLVIDALLGVGVSGDLREPLRTMAKLANSSHKKILAVDVPTGLSGRTAIRPDATVTLHDRKRGMTRANSGTILVRDIGIPPAVQHEIGPGDLAIPYPRNPPTSHKGENGRLLIVAGGPYCGAPLLAATAALRTGIDLVRLYTPTQCAQAARAHAPDLIVHEGSAKTRLEPDDVDAIGTYLGQVDALLVGPGLGLDRPTRDAVETLLGLTQRRKIPLVLDADALVVAGQHPALLPRRPVIVTPHAGEFRKLTGRPVPRLERDAIRVTQREARRLRVTCLLKGPTDVITDGRRTKLGRVHHPFMTAGGTGDALAGATAALLAKGLDAFASACAGAFLTGAAGVRAFEEFSWGARATDVVASIPWVLRSWTQS